VTFSFLRLAMLQYKTMAADAAGQRDSWNAAGRVANRNFHLRE